MVVHCARRIVDAATLFGAVVVTVLFVCALVWTIRRNSEDPFFSGAAVGMGGDERADGRQMVAGRGRGGIISMDAVGSSRCSRHGLCRSCCFKWLLVLIMVLLVLMSLLLSLRHFHSLRN